MSKATSIRTTAHLDGDSVISAEMRPSGVLLVKLGGYLIEREETTHISDVDLWMPASTALTLYHRLGELLSSLPVPEPAEAV